MFRPEAISVALVVILAGTPLAAANLGATPPGVVGGVFVPRATNGASVAGGDKRNGRRVVAVVRTPGADGTSQEIVTRIIAELVATGVPVMVLTCSTADSNCLPVAGRNLSAVVLVQRHNNVPSIEVRTGDAFESGGAGTLVAISDERGRAQRLGDGDARGEPAALAIRTVELLRAMLPDEAATPPTRDAQDSRSSQDPPIPQIFDERPVKQQPDPDPVPEPAIARAADGRAIVPPGSHNVTMNVGIALIGGFSGLQTAYGPTLSIGRRTSEHVLLSIVLDGPAFGPDQSGPTGTASIRQEMAIVQADLLGLFWKAVVLRAGIGAGVYHIRVDGTGSTLFGGTNGMFDSFVPRAGSAGGFSWLVSWSAGVVANLRQDVGVFLDWRMFVLTPTQAVALNGLELGRAGNPGMTLSSGVELRF